MEYLKPTLDWGIYSRVPCGDQELHNRHTQAYSATLTAKLGSVDLTAVSGYSIRRFSEWQDYTSLFTPRTDAATIWCHRHARP